MNIQIKITSYEAWISKRGVTFTQNFTSHIEHYCKLTITPLAILLSNYSTFVASFFLQFPKMPTTSILAPPHFHHHHLTSATAASFLTGNILIASTWHPTDSRVIVKKDDTTFYASGTACQSYRAAPVSAMRVVMAGSEVAPTREVKCWWWKLRQYLIT